MKRKLFVIFNFIFWIILGVNSVWASDIYSAIYGGTQTAVNSGMVVVNWIIYAVDVAAVAMVMYLGIKLVVSSPEGKADVKKHLVMLVIGLAISIFLSTLVNWIATEVAEPINNIASL